MILVFMGKQSTGKGTYADMAFEEYGWPHISTGELFRQEVKKGTGLGKKVQALMDKGIYIDDETTTKLLKKRLMEKDCEKGLVLDGYPRNINQAKELDKMLEELKKKIDLVFYFDASDETIIFRVTGRVQCFKCGRIYHMVGFPPKKGGVCDSCGGEVGRRKDDLDQEALKKRLQQSAELTQPILDYYEGKGLLLKVDANRERQFVFEDVKKILKQRMK